MIDDTKHTRAQDARIDERILKHLLHEATDLLEESQTHALVEPSTVATAHILLQLNWRLTATTSWALSELSVCRGENGQAARLHAPAPIFSRDPENLSNQLLSLMSRVNRLHERACRLDELSRSPVVVSTEQNAVANSKEETDTFAPSANADVIQLFDTRDSNAEPDNYIRSTQNQLNWIFAVRD